MNPWIKQRLADWQSSKSMKFRHSLENYLVICLFAVVSLVTAYSIVSAANSGANPQPEPTSMPSVENCSSQDTSFCGTEQFFRDLISRRDFSSILENQTPVRIACSGATRTQAYCEGVKDGLAIQLFRVDQGSRSQLLTRNQYIAFFRSYFQQYGPFTYRNEAATGSDILIRYENRTGTEIYTLHFTKADSAWKLVYPTVGAT